MELQCEILCLGKPFYRKRAPSFIRSRRNDQGEQGIYHVMVFGDGGFADSCAPCTGRKDTEPAHNGTTRKISRSKGVVLKHGGYGSGLAAIVRGASSCRFMGYRTQNAQRVQRMGGFAPTQPRTQRDNARGVAAGSWQTCGKSEQTGTNGSAWLVAGIARALGRDCKHGTSRNAAFRRLSQKPAGDTENKHRSAIGTEGDRRHLQRDVWLPDASRAR